MLYICTNITLINSTCFCCPCLINVLLYSPLSDPIFNFPSCVASHQFISTKMNLTYILISVNLFNFFKGGGGIASSAFILFFYLYWYSYIVYFVCDSASEFGAIGSSSFLGFSYLDLLLVFLNLLFFRNLFIYFIFTRIGTPI